jgi:hypothetical protein
MADKMHHDKGHSRHFMSEEDIQEMLSPVFGRPPSTQNKGVQRGKEEADEKFIFSMWYKAGDHHKATYDHTQTIGRSNYDCDSITDEWYTWFLTTPASLSAFSNPSSQYGDEEKSGFEFNKDNGLVYFGGASPFLKPDFRRIRMTKQAPLLIPVYNVCASVQQFPSLKHEKDPDATRKELINLIWNDIRKINPKTFVAKLDGEPIYGCSVIRDKEALRIKNVPKNNIFNLPESELLNEQTGLTMDIYHGGFWLLIKEDVLKPGDHLLYFKAESAVYEMEAKILINAIY